MTTFWAVEEQFTDSTGWSLAGGVEGRHQLHLVLEGPNPDPRQPPEPEFETRGMPSAYLRYGATLDLDQPPPVPASPQPRYPLYVLVLGLPNGDQLRSFGGGTGHSRSKPGGVYQPSYLEARYAIPDADVTRLTATLYDDDQAIATGRLFRLRG